MAKITVELEAFYGYSCGFQGHGSNETVELEVSDSELDALKKFGKEQITAEDIVAAIESGDTTLQSLHEKLEEKFYYMVERRRSGGRRHRRSHSRTGHRRSW